jgi:hypothetical protein
VLLSKFLDQGPLKVLPQFHPFPKSWTEGPKNRGAEESVKQIVVVERDRQKLYEYVKRAFSGNASVDVVLDRRRSERRGSGDRSRAPGERRRGDRRLMNEIDNHLRALGWAVVRLDVFRTLGLPHRSGR